jgi:hypothetical protein
VSDEEAFYEPLQENEYSDISGNEYSNDTKINVKISSCDEQSVSSDAEEKVSDSSMQHGIWAKSGAERPRFPYTGKPGINVDLEDPSNPLECFKLFCIPEIVEVIARKSNQHDKKKFLKS